MVKILLVLGFVGLLFGESYGACGEYKDCGGCTAATEELEVCW